MERYATVNYAFLLLPGLYFTLFFLKEKNVTCLCLLLAPKLHLLGAFLFPLLLYFTKQPDVPLLVRGIKHQRPHFETLPHFLAPNPRVLKCGMQTDYLSFSVNYKMLKTSRAGLWPK